MKDPFSKKVFLVSLGCPKNLVDSEVMLGLLAREGCLTCASAEEADLLLINTCGFIQPAVEEAIDAIIDLCQIKKEQPSKRLVVTGCLVQRFGSDLRQELPEVDLFVGTDGFQDIVQSLKRMESGESRPCLQAEPLFLMDSLIPRLVSTPPHRSYLKISEGCSNRCAYCLIPSLRGPLRSRSSKDIVVEAKRLGELGVKELTLVGQDLTAYGQDLGREHAGLTRLLERILTGCDIPWIRLLYLYPDRLEDGLLRLMAAEPRLLSYLDIPLQHVSDSVLKRMKRPSKGKKLGELIEKIRLTVPDATIRTTFMVGFPGETEEDVNRLAHFMKKYRLDHVGIFSYSNEEGCLAEKLSGHCTDSEKEQRRQRIMELQAGISSEINQRRLGKKIQVLVEGISPETDLLLEGRGFFQAPEIDGRIYINDGECKSGDFVDVEITETYTYDLAGGIV